MMSDYSSECMPEATDNEIALLLDFDKASKIWRTEAARHLEWCRQKWYTSCVRDFGKLLKILWTLHPATVSLDYVRKLEIVKVQSAVKNRHKKAKYLWRYQVAFCVIEVATVQKSRRMTVQI